MYVYIIPLGVFVYQMHLNNHRHISHYFIGTCQGLKVFFVCLVLT